MRLNAHIVRALLILVRTLNCRNCSLAHHERGVTLKNILDIARDHKKFVAWTNIVYNFLIMNWALFSGIHTTCDTFSNLHSNILILLSYDLDKYARVVENVKALIGMIAY